MKAQLSQPAIVVSGAVLLILILAGIFHGAIDRQMRAWKLLPEPEKLTELYFTHPNDLPARYTPGQTQAVSFTTHNLEYQTTRYSYQIVEASQTSSQRQTLAAGAFTLPQDAYHTTTVNIPTADLGQRVKVEVVLSNVKESIDYLLERATT